MRIEKARRSLSGTAVVISLVAISGCSLFVAESEFYLENDTSYSLTVSWIEYYDGSADSLVEAVRPGETALLASGEILEADELPPSLYFTSLSISAEPNGTGTRVYVQDPMDDQAWVREEQRSRGDYTYTLILNDEDLSLPAR